MHYIEPRQVAIRAKDFEMNGVIEGSQDSFRFQSSNTHFTYYFPSGEVDSLRIKKKELSQTQAEIIELCENKISELLSIGN